QRVDSVHDFKHHEGKAECVQRQESGSAKLREELRHVPMEKTRHTLACCAKVRCRSDAIPACPVGTIGENTDTNGSQPAAVSVHGDSPAGIVDLDHPLIKENPQT